MKPLMARNGMWVTVCIVGLIALTGLLTAVLIATHEIPSTTKKNPPNRLIHEKSPYLLQHAHNPVDWYPWSDEAFQKARKENKLIFLSVGYSTCYWCHVMEREVFENQELASLMNQFFVSIKVDREERPDLDRIYMSALQAMTGSGGWPMSLILTPDLKPAYGATYIPPEDFRKLVREIQKVWTAQPEKIRDSSQQLTNYLKQQTVQQHAKGELEKSVLTKAFEQFRQSHDQQHGGFDGAPKFPRPVVFNFLLHYYSRFADPEPLQMTLRTLRKMSEGGIYDHLGGGFHRYSVDGQWRVPHFEKMLYDQAQLVCSYLDAYQITRDETYASIARQTIEYVRRNLTDKEGGFYSAEDAESAVEATQPEKKEEGAFYVWTAAEIERGLGKEKAGVFGYVFGVKSGGNAFADPHKVFTGKNILYLAHTPEEATKQFNKSLQSVNQLLTESRTKLLAERERRPKPHLDDKILVSWNGLMISALARAYQVLDDATYLRAAETSAEFILRKLYDENGKRLLRRYRSGESRYEAHLQDYAFLTMGLLDLYESSLEFRWLQRAIELTYQQNSLFQDDKNGGFFDTSGKDVSLLFRTKEDDDNAEPSGNSIATLNLLRLAQMTNNSQWRAVADRTLAHFVGQRKEFPQVFPQMLVGLDFHLDKPKQIIIAGNPHREDTKRMLREVHKHYLPNKIVMLADGGEGQLFLGQYLPFIQFMKMTGDKATAYICENYACKLPTSDVNIMASLLEGKPAPR